MHFGSIVGDVQIRNSPVSQLGGLLSAQKINMVLYTSLALEKSIAFHLWETTSSSHCSKITVSWSTLT